MRMSFRVAAIGAVIAWGLCLGAPAARAQEPPSAGRQPGRPGSLELSAAAIWLAPGSLGTNTATLTTNGSSVPFTYFQAEGRMDGALGVDARVAYNLTRLFAVEGGFVLGRPQVSFSVSNDAEGATGFTAEGERLTQIFADGTLLVFPRALAFSQGRGRGFVGAGVGYLRQLHAGNLNVDTGSVYNAGAGMKYYFEPRASGVVKGLGVRAELRAYYTRGGYRFDSGSGWALALLGGAIAAF